MKTIVTFSGGKDSLDALLYVRNNLTKNFITVFCDTGWEHPLTYQYIKEIEQKLGLDLRVLKSKKYDGMIDMSRKKKRFPSSGRRFYTNKLHELLRLMRIEKLTAVQARELSKPNEMTLDRALSTIKQVSENGNRFIIEMPTSMQIELLSLGYAISNHTDLRGL